MENHESYSGIYIIYFKSISKFKEDYIRKKLCM